MGEPMQKQKIKSRTVAIVLALFFGGIGAHKFYIYRGFSGILYLLFCWTGIPSILSFFDSMSYLFTSKTNEEFTEKFVVNHKVMTGIQGSFLVVLALVVAVALVLFALIIKTFIVGTFYIPAGSMIPTLDIKDRVIGNKFIYKFHVPHRQDVIIFKYPGDNKTYFVKRLIGLPGDLVELKHGDVYINNQILDESKYPVMKDQCDFGPILVSPQSYFTLGDNRANSADSRYWGYVPVKNLVAKVILTYWPVNHIKVIP